MALEYAQRETDETLCECLCMVAHRGGVGDGVSPSGHHPVSVG